MKKRATLLTMVFAVAGLIGMALPAAAAELHDPHTGGTYGCTYGEYHFVNNQTDGARRSFINVQFSGGDVDEVWASKTNRNVQHFIVRGYGRLLDAQTPRLDGRLVLSDYKCLCHCGCGPS